MKQPNKWSCLPTALAILLNKSVDEIIATIGHDGSEEIPGNPHDRRCFYDLEIIIAAYKLGVHLVPFVPYLEIKPGRVDTLLDTKTFLRLLECHNGLVCSASTGRVFYHSLVWMHGLFHDPNGGDPMTLGHFNERWNVEVFLAWMNPPPVF